METKVFVNSDAIAGEEQMKKRLYRNKKNSKLAGVCSGMGDYLNIDPVIIRLLFVLTFFAGAGPIAYIISWIVIPIDKS